MPRNKNGRAQHRNGPETEDLITALNAIYIDHGVSAEIHAYIALDGRMYVECTADVFVAGQPIISLSEGRYAPSEPYGIMSASLVAIHAIYHTIDRLEARRVAAVAGKCT